MGITFSNKEINAQRIDCGGSFQVRLSLTGAPDITSNPTDIVLLLDRSGSMAGSALTSLKEGANTFVDIISQATGGGQDGTIGSGSRISVVSFAADATADTQLITSVAELKTAIDGLTADGFTNHAAAFEKASELLMTPSTNAKVVVLFTDGNTTAGADPTPIATALKGGGAVIYAIGLTGENGVDPANLNNWASTPSASYVFLTPNAQDLEDIFANLAENISKTGATNIQLTDRISPCFRITSVSMPTKGTASLVDANSVRWEIDELGVTGSEGAVLEFNVEHIGPCSGAIEVNESIAYSDAEGNVVTFPSPEIDVECDDGVCVESCPEPTDLTMTSCEDFIQLDAGDMELESQGRIVELQTRLRSICPNRRVALAAFLSEVDEDGFEHKRGMKTIVIPAHDREGCRDVTVRCIRFVVPEILTTTGSNQSLCGTRNFRARFIAHYIDHDFDCIGEGAPI